MLISFNNTAEHRTMGLSARRLIHTPQRLMLISTGVPTIQESMAVRLVSMTVDIRTAPTLSPTSSPVGITREDRMVARNQTEDG
jgi:hypothetical protein